MLSCSLRPDTLYPPFIPRYGGFNIEQKCLVLITILNVFSHLGGAVVGMQKGRRIAGGANYPPLSSDVRHSAQ